MKEIRDIIKAYDQAAASGLNAALATVVKVTGSSYRQPGARMLVTEDGLLTGAISGGCLEGDALKKALLCINQQQNKLITYDTSNEDDVEFGVQLGCNGIVHILFEYIDNQNKLNPINLLRQTGLQRQGGVLMTQYNLNRKAAQPGTILFSTTGREPLLSDAGATAFIADADEVIKLQRSAIKKSDDGSEILIDYIAPPIALVIAGAGNDVQPLTAVAAVPGWEITVADGRASHAKPARFPEAEKVLVANPDELLRQVAIDAQTCFLLMTHNYNYDVALLTLLLKTPCPYIGVLGPKTKLDRMLEDIKAGGTNITKHDLNRIYGPVGLDIGAETSQEIALSVVAEIKAVMSGKKGTSLRLKQEKIHNATIVA